MSSFSARFQVVAMKPHLNSRAFALFAVYLLCMALFLFPWSPSPQPSGFSVTPDMDEAAGDQAVSSLDLLPDQAFSLQLFGKNIQGATGISARLRFDASQVAYEGFEPGDALPGVLVLECVRDGERRILLRLGSTANRRDSALFDGAFTVLEVREVDGGGFAGIWRSSGRLSRTGGYFCARRADK